MPTSSTTSAAAAIRVRWSCRWCWRWRDAAACRDATRSWRLLAGYDLAARVLEGAAATARTTIWAGTRPAPAAASGRQRRRRASCKLDRARFADALGIAGTFTGGIWAFLADGAMTKRFHPGKAAENGLSAALLAQAGMTGPRQVLEAKWGGFFSTYSPGIATPEATLDGLGKEFRIDRSGMKPYACCRGLHACLDALFQIMPETDADSQRHPPHDRARQRAVLPPVRPAPSRQTCSMRSSACSTRWPSAAVSGRATLDQFQPQRTAEPGDRAADGGHDAARRPHASSPATIRRSRSSWRTAAASSVMCCSPRARRRTR